ncbi:hypothetical protein ONZ45_g1072 [Pleurotus djamor]|nr:hypothetical protein ONZ45_g1072 [Pleurotus djamor]
MVIVEFVNDITSEGEGGGKLLPGDAWERGKARFYINVVMTTIQPVFLDCILILEEGSAGGDFAEGEEKEEKEEGGDGASSSRDNTKGKFMMGEKFTLPDAITAAWFLDIDAFLDFDMGSLPLGEGVKAHTEVQTSPKFVKYQAYLGRVTGRESVCETFDKAFHLEKLGSCAVSLR